MSDKVIELIKTNQEDKVKPDSYLDIEFTDGSKASHITDFFGVSDELNGFLCLWRDNEDIPVCFYNLSLVKKLSVREVEKTDRVRVNDAGFIIAEEEV